MVLRLDDTVGIILETLEELGILDQTVIIFASDNGHEVNYEEVGRCRRREDAEGRRFDNITYHYTSERAGDVFNGALAVALAEKMGLRDAVRFANAAAALSVTRLGAQPSAPTRDQIVGMLEKG